MGKKVLALLFSGRKNGNSSIMLNEILKPVRAAGLDAEAVNAALLNIRPCAGCFGCNNATFRCVIRDDLEALKEKIAEADLIILASPCYIFGPPAMMKNILDRSAAWALDRIERGSTRKIGLSVAFAGAYGEWCSMQKALSSLFLKTFGCDVRLQKVYERVALKGEILLHPEILQDARRIGEAAVGMLNGDVVETGLPADGGALCCPDCRSDLFRVEGRRYICAVCGSVLHRGALGLRREENVGKFTPEGAAAHSEFVGGKIVNGFQMGEEIGRRLERYLAENVVPTETYQPEAAAEPSSIEWEEEALQEFTRLVPRSFQMFVKKAVERKAAAQGIRRISKADFLAIKKASGN